MVNNERTAMTQHLTPDYERHGEHAVTQVRAGIAEIYGVAQRVRGWMAGSTRFDARDMERINEAITIWGALHDTIVVVHEEAELLDIREAR